MKIFTLTLRLEEGVNCTTAKRSDMLIMCTFFVGLTSEERILNIRLTLRFVIFARGLLVLHGPKGLVGALSPVNQ